MREKRRNFAFSNLARQRTRSSVGRYLVVFHLLSGANNDGAAGLKAVAEAGGKAIVQSPKGAFAAAMPEAAKAMCPDAQVLTPQQIAAYLQKVSSLP